MITTKHLATLERLVELKRQRAALTLGQLRQSIAAVDTAADQARQDANPPPPVTGAVASDHFQVLALLQTLDIAHQRHLQKDRQSLLEALPAAEDRLRRAKATVEAMDLLGKRVARAEKTKLSRREEIAAAAEAANRPKIT